MIEEKTTLEYSTPDTVLASYLQSQGITMIRLDKGHVSQFIFPQPPDELLTKFFTGTAEVNLQAWFRNYKYMLKLVHGR